MIYFDVKGFVVYLDVKSLSIKLFLNVIINVFILDDCLYCIFGVYWRNRGMYLSLCVYFGDMLM